MGQAKPFLEFRLGWFVSISPVSCPPFPPSVLYNAGDYAEGRGCPSGLLALSTYKGVIEMFSQSPRADKGWLSDGDEWGDPDLKAGGREGGRGRP